MTIHPLTTNPVWTNPPEIQPRVREVVLGARLKPHMASWLLGVTYVAIRVAGVAFPAYLPAPSLLIPQPFPFPVTPGKPS